MAPSSPWMVVVLLGAMGLLGLAMRRRFGAQVERSWRLRWAVLAGTVLLAAGLAACGGGSGGGGGGSTTPTNPGTPAGTYSLTVTGTSGNLAHSTNLTLSVK